jgi:tRNA(Glu) U13 pseudouridine synthase TruD
VLSNAKRRRFEDKVYPDKYLIFTLTKSNNDSLGAIGFLARFLARKPSCFGVAGTKVLVF